MRAPRTVHVLSLPLCNLLPFNTSCFITWSKLAVLRTFCSLQIFYEAGQPKLFSVTFSQCDWAANVDCSKFDEKEEEKEEEQEEEKEEEKEEKKECPADGFFEHKTRCKQALDLAEI